MLNLLTDPVIRIDVSGGDRVRKSLPETYALLMQDMVDAFPALRPHQRHPLHAFLVQLGAIAMRREGLEEPPEDPDEWRDIIRALTPDFPDDEPWRMAVEDVAKPAFLQPPVSSERKLADYKNSVNSPDELDMLVTSKNHDLKASVVSLTDADDWLFALITLQTSAGFSGSGNYGISRMNGGFGSRPSFTITPSTRPGAHTRRDITVLRERRGDLMNNNLSLFADDGPELIWTLPWDGAKSEALTLDQLGPLYIEVCRRIRLVGGRAVAHAIRATSKGPRIEARALKGKTGDPWTPISNKDSKSLTLSAGGFGYRRTADYIKNWEWAPLFKPTSEEVKSRNSLMLVARGMVRGQGGTEGYYERHIPIKRQTKTRLFGRGGGAVALGTLAEARVKDVADVQRILRHAVSVFAAGGKTDGVSDEHRARANPWTNRLNEIVDVNFFEALQEEFVEDDRDRQTVIRYTWLRTVRDSALDTLRDAEDALPCPASQRLRARVKAESVFSGRMRREFPMLFDVQEANDDDDNH